MPLVTYQLIKHKTTINNKNKLGEGSFSIVEYDNTIKMGGN